MNFVARSGGSGQFLCKPIAMREDTFNNGICFVWFIAVRREICLDLDAGCDFFVEQVLLVEEDDERGGRQEL